MYNWLTIEMKYKKSYKTSEQLAILYKKETELNKKTTDQSV